MFWVNPTCSVFFVGSEPKYYITAEYEKLELLGITCFKMHLRTGVITDVVL